jgi:chromatin segregation and condensation protein Rec8/ScpA/Scc1 (kleisin family)
MENISRLPSVLRQPIDSCFICRAVDRTREVFPDKIVMISSHPEWPGEREQSDDRGSNGEVAADTVHLTRVFHEMLERVRQGPVLNMEDEPVTIAQMEERVWQRFAADDAPIRLSHMLRNARSERALICTFLALLELVRLRMISIRQDRTISDVVMKRNAAPASTF